MLHGAGFREEAGARNRVFIRVKWLQPAMKGTSCVRRVRFGSFRSQSVPPLCVLQRVDTNRIVMATWMCTWCCKTHCNGCVSVAWGLFLGRKPEHETMRFFRVKWLQPAMKGTSCVRRVRLGSFRGQSVPPVCSATSECKSHCICCLDVYVVLQNAL